MENAKALGKTICEVLLLTTPPSRSNDKSKIDQRQQQQPPSQQHVQSFSKQIAAMHALRSLPPEERRKLISGSTANASAASSSTSSSASTAAKTLLRIDEMQRSIFGSSLSLKTTSAYSRSSSSSSDDDDDHKKGVDEEIDNNEQQAGLLRRSALLEKIVSEARASCQVHRLPRPGTEQFFLGATFLSSTPTTPGASQQELECRQRGEEERGARSGMSRRRQREGEVDDEQENDQQQERQEDEDNDEEDEEDENQRFGLDKPVIDGVSFISFVTCVARSLVENKKFHKLLQSENVCLATSNPQQDPISYRIVHLVVTLLLNLVRRVQCYSQCGLDLQSKLSTMITNRNKENEKKDDVQAQENEQDEAKTKKRMAVSVSLVKRALEHCTNMRQKFDAQRFLTISSDPIKSQKTFHNSQLQETVVKVDVALDGSSGSCSRCLLSLKLIGNLEGSRLAVHAAVDSLK